MAAAAFVVLGSLVAFSGDRSGPAELPGVLVSRQLAEARDLSPGDLVKLSAHPDGTGASTFRIVEIYEPVADPMRFTRARHEARMHLPDLLQLTAEPGDPEASETVTAINVSLEDPTEAAAFIRDLTARAPGLVAVSTAPSENEATVFDALERFHTAIAMVTVIASTAFLLALMVMRAEERRETVGILRLLGFSKRHILSEVLIEGAFIALAGAVFGVVVAAATEDAVNRFFQWRYDTSLVFVDVTPGIVARCVAFAVPLGVIAGVVASWTLLRRDIVALLRR
ncbi:MAG: FtsX-like permease family protein [Acidobacteriota bacterium]|nr:FtsX-like permease family protein [Acidobacteriota bacterium]